MVFSKPYMMQLDSIHGHVLTDTSGSRKRWKKTIQKYTRFNNKVLTLFTCVLKSIISGIGHVILTSISMCFWKGGNVDSNSVLEILKMLVFVNYAASS